MIELRIASSDLKDLRDSLLGCAGERCAVLFATRGNCTDSRDLMLVRETMLTEDDDYIESGIDHAQLQPDFVARAAKHARLNGFSLIFVHTHPGECLPKFSQIDDLGEKELAAFLIRREQGKHHAALVLSNGGMSARILGRDEPVRVVSVGGRRLVEFEPGVEQNGEFTKFDRQIRAFGQVGQRILSNLRVAVVGLGGTGSIAVQQLMYLGIQNFILIDHDNIEITNLNRVVGATKDDVGHPKCEIALRNVRQFYPDAQVLEINGDVVHESIARHLVDADIIFCCTDTYGSRSVVQQVAYQYFIPCIDIGTTITTDSNKIRGIYGRVQLIGPDKPCLWCSELLNSEEVRRDMLNETERRADPYIQGARMPAPSVISINGTVVSHAITMLLGIVTSIPVESHHVIYDAIRPSLRSVRFIPKDGCFICSRSGVFGQGDSQGLFARKD